MSIIPEVEVRQWHGAPALFINGRPDTGLMFWHSRVFQAAEDIAGFAQAGVNLFTPGCGAGSAMVEGGGYDFSHIDRVIEAVLAANPQALIMPRIGIDPPGYWAQKHPDEMALHVEVAGGRQYRQRPCYASAPWRRDLGAALAAMIRHCEEKWGSHIMGYQPAAGDCGEWSYPWLPVLSDFSRPQQAAFRQYLQQVYDRDNEALRRAWKDPGVTFLTAEIPADRTRVGEQWSILDPQRERRIVDYLRFHNEGAAGTIVHFCGVVKEELRRLGRRKICGVFYGYHFFDVLIPGSLHNNGHHALGIVLDCPDVDFLAAPCNYQERHAGGMYYSQLIPGACALHGKLYYNEDDTFTFLARKLWWRYVCPDRATTINVLRRNLLGVIREGGTQWWMDHGGEGWYRDAGLMEEVASLRRLFASRLEADRASSAQVAVIVSDESLAFMRQDEGLTDSLLSRQVSELAALGTSYDVYRAADLEKLFGSPAAGAYRLVIFLDCVYLTPQERQAIREKVACDGRTLLWVYAAGLATDDELSTDAMRELTGLSVKLRYLTWPPVVASYLTGTRVAYGTDKAVGPILSGDDPAATVLGWLLFPAEQGLLEKDMGSWRSIWSAAPAVPAVLLREFARRAGVHIYDDAGDQVFAWHDMLALHAASDGKRIIRLPRRSRVVGAFDGREIASGVTEFTVDLQRGQTPVWSIEPA